MTCHHKACCGCDRSAELVAEVVGTDGVTEFELCEPHFVLLTQEAARKGLPLIGVSPVTPSDSSAPPDPRSRPSSS